MRLPGSVGAILWKDLLLELRSKEVLTASIVFAVLVVIVFHFAFPEELGFTAKTLAPGCLWVAFAFSGMLALNRSFAQEKDGQRIHGLMLAPIDRSSIFIAKFLGSLLFMLFIEAVVFPVFAVLFNLTPGPYIGKMLLVFVLGSTGFAAVGTLFSAVAANTRMRDVMLPVLLLPVSFPLLQAAVESCSILLDGDPQGVFGRWLGVLAAYDVIFIAVSYGLFEYAIEE